MSFFIYKSKKKAIWVLVGGVMLVAGGLLFMLLSDDNVSGWIFLIFAVMCILLGIGQLTDRKPKIVITENGITDLSVIREEIEWEAVVYVEQFWYRGQDFICILLPREYKPDLVRPSWFWRFDKIYITEGVKAVYIRTGGLEVNSGQLTVLIERMAKADSSQRENIIFALDKKTTV